MKNFVHFTFVISLLLVFSGYSKDDNDDDKRMSYIHVKAHYDSEGITDLRFRKQQYSEF